MTVSTPVSVSASASSVAVLVNSHVIHSMPFENLVFITFEVSNYTGRKSMRPEDIGLDAKDLPPKVLATLGSMASCDPQPLKKFESYRAQMRNFLLKYGTKVMGLFAIPVSKLDEAISELNRIKDSFYADKSLYLSTFLADRSNWLSKADNVQWVKFLTKKRLDSHAHVDSRIQCDWYGWTMGATSDISEESAKALSAGLDGARKAMANNVLDEIAVDANSIYETRLHNKDGSKATEVTQKFLRYFKSMLEKLDGLSFIDPKVGKVSEYIRSILALLPREGKLSAGDLTQVFNLIVALKDPSLLLEIIEGTYQGDLGDITGDDVQQLLDIVTPAQAAITVDSTPVEDEADDQTLSTTAPAATVDTSEDSSAVNIDPDLVYDEQ